MNPRKYRQWGEFLRKIRSENYRSAREFCLKAGLEISYPQYSRYEAGEQLPTLELALTLFSLLRVPTLQGILEWSRAQVHTPAAQAEIDALISRAAEDAAREVAGGEAGSQAPVEPARIPLDDLFVFNRSHLRLFQSDPTYRDIFTYINSYAPDSVTSAELSEVLQIELSRVEGMLQELYDHGVIIKERSGTDGELYSAAKRNYYFPDDEDFFELRNQNLKRNMDVILGQVSFEGLSAKKVYRSLVTRELTEEQFDRMIRRADELLSEAIHLPETRNPEKIYSLCFLMGSRFTRPAKYLKANANPGLTTGNMSDLAQGEKPDAVQFL